MGRSTRRRSAALSVPALEKGLDILEALVAANAPQYLSDPARTLGGSSSGLFRALSSLKKRTYVIEGPPSRRYRLSRKRRNAAQGASSNR